MADLGIEDTNRIRASLGMKLLPVPGGGPSFKSAQQDDESSSSEEEQGSTLESRQAQGYDNWKALQGEADAKRKREAKAEAVKKARDAAQKFSRLEGKGLADDAEGELDTKTWLLQQKKRRKRIEKEREKAAKLERELAERERGIEHTAADLSGVNVTHSLEDFEGGEEQILTLKDATIDQNEEEGDELENAELREREVLREKLSSKKKKPVYDPHAEAEDGRSTILGHYDEAIDGKKRKRFQLDGQGVSAEDREVMKQAVGERLKAQPISLDIVQDGLISDYAELAEAKLRKPKKKKPKATRRRASDEDDLVPAEQMVGPDADGDVMELDAVGGRTIGAKSNLTERASFVDDDDLQASLAIQRRAALKKRKKTTPENLVQRLREEASVTPGAIEDDEPEEQGGLLLDETTEFVDSLRRAKEEEEEKPRAEKVPSATPVKEETPREEDGRDVEMADMYGAGEGEDLKAQTDRTSSAPPPEMTETGLEEDVVLNRGLGATLSMLAQRGLVNARTEEDVVGLHRDRQRFLLEKQKREADIERKARQQRERDRASGKLDQMSAREREEYARYENRQRDQLESRQMTDIFNREYKPDVQLKYVDEFGRSMKPKEAFKHLSHQFHGKGSGKQKVEKHLKKIEDEKKKEAQSTLDSSEASGMNKAMGATARRTKQAGVRMV